MDEYEKDLYNTDNVVCGLRTPVVQDPNTRQRTGGELVGVFVQNGDSFGLLIADEGRGIAMNSRGYESPVKDGQYSGPEKINRVSISNPIKGYILYRDNIEMLNDQNRQDFQNLFDENKQLNPADRIKFGTALLNYSNNHKPSNLPISETKKERAACRYLKKTRPNNRKDRKRAKSEYEALPVIASPATERELDSGLLTVEANLVLPVHDNPIPLAQGHRIPPVGQGEDIPQSAILEAFRVPLNGREPVPQIGETGTDLNPIEAAVVNQIVNRSGSQSSDQSRSSRRSQQSSQQSSQSSSQSPSPRRGQGR